MKHNERKTFSARFTDEIREIFNEISDLYPEYNDQQIVTEIITRAKAPVPNYDVQNEIEDLQAVNDNLLIEIEDLKHALQTKNVEIQELKSTVHETADVEALEEQLLIVTQNNEELTKQLSDAEQRANHNATLLEVADLSKHELQTGEYIVKLDDVANEMMQVMVNRLRKKMQDPSISPALIFSDLFVKYTVQRPCDFAYPPQISKDEVKVIISRYR